jgi:hypothetical protein
LDKFTRRKPQIRRAPDLPSIAPPADLVRYMAFFHRAFAAIDDYTVAGDKQGMLLGGWLADALHNVPGVLQHYSDDSSQNALHMTNRIEVLPNRLLNSNAPERLITDCTRILSETDTARDLGLQDDLSDIDIAPDTEMILYLHILAKACIYMRMAGNCESKSENRWEDLDSSWNKWAYNQAKLSGLVASTLRTLPSGLVKWSEFDRNAFRRHVLNATINVPRPKQLYWYQVHHTDQPGPFSVFRWLNRFMWRTKYGYKP